MNKHDLEHIEETLKNLYNTALSLCNDANQIRELKENDTDFWLAMQVIIEKLVELETNEKLNG